MKRVFCLMFVVCLFASNICFAENVNEYWGTNLPVFERVELENPNPDPLLPLPDPSKYYLNPYEPNEDNFIKDEATGAPYEYRDSTIYIKVESRVIKNSNVFFTWIQIADPTQLLTFATNYESSPLTMTNRLNAVIGINGDWFTGHGKTGVIYRNGVLMRPEKKYGNYDALIIDKQGDFHILYRPSLEDFEPYKESVVHSFLFGPALVIDGKLQEFETFVYGSGQGMGLDHKTQRQALCQVDKLTYMIITTEGPKENKGGGFDIVEFAKLCYDMGVKNAYNFDGANSTCLIFGNKKINRYKKSSLRYVTDMIYFVTAEPSK